MIVSLIVAAAANDVIGRDGAIPWHLPVDLRRFRAVTSGHVVVMGRVTHESILARLGRPLPGRTSVVITRGGPGSCGSGVVQAGSVAAGLAEAAQTGRAAGSGELFVIGGASVYEQALPVAGRIYLTRLHQEVDGDRWMPAGWLDGFVPVAQRHIPPAGDIPGCSFLDYERARA